MCVSPTPVKVYMCVSTSPRWTLNNNRSHVLIDTGGGQSRLFCWVTLRCRIVICGWLLLLKVHHNVIVKSTVTVTRQCWLIGSVRHWFVKILSKFYTKIAHLFHSNKFINFLDHLSNFYANENRLQPREFNVIFIDCQKWL